MIELVRSRRLYVPPKVVWDALADFASIARWAPQVDHSCLLTEQSSGVGAVRRIQAGRNTVTETVIEWQEPLTLAYSISGLPPVVGSVTNRWIVVPSRDESLVTLTTSITPGPRPPQAVVAKLVGGRLAAASESMLAGLDAHVAGTVAA